MTFWFFVLGIPLLALGLSAVLVPAATGRVLVAFPRNVLAGRILCAVGWLWTASACDRLGIDIFDKFLKMFPGELWILAIVLTVLTCWWMENLLPIRGVCAIAGMFGMFYPWWIRKGLAWTAERPSILRAGGASLATVGALFAVLGALSAAGVLK